MLLHEYMEYFAREFPESPCVIMDDVSLTFQEANRRANRIADACIKAGLQSGDRIAWLSRNSIDLMLIFFAASKVGVAPVPLNYRLAPAEWQYIINDSGATVMVCDDEYCIGINSVRSELGNIRTFVKTSLGDTPSDQTANDEGNWVDLENWLDGTTEDNPEHYGLATDDLYQMYTSGTTGLPKGAVLSQGAIDSNTRMVASQYTLSRESRILVPLPMYHAAAAVTIMLTTTTGGCVYIHRDFDPVATIDDMQQHAITNITLVPAMIQACLMLVPDIEEREFPALKTMTYGASPIAAETLRKAMEVFQCQFFQAFGMTETTAVATVLGADSHLAALKDKPHLLASCGRAALGTLVKIVDADHKEVPRGTVGEISVRGPQVMKQYWNLPEATEKTLQDGWLYTGDAAYMDDEGYVFIQDRIKDMIVTGGENVYPAEVESALFDHANIADAAVIGIPDDKWGEAILAFIVTRDGATIADDELIEFVRDRLAGYKVPRRFEFLPEVPRNPSGKALKKDLREPYWRGIERRVG